MKNKGITLISLVITIIILLILVGISIAQLTESGLFEKAKLAKEKSENAQEKEELSLNNYENEIEKYIGSTRVEKEFNFSTEEHIVGKWIDNKDIYAKTIEITSLKIGQWNEIDTLCNNIDTVVDYEGKIKARSGNWYNVPSTNGASGDDSYSILCSSIENKFKIYIGSVMSFDGKGHITIYYTKNI